MEETFNRFGYTCPIDCLYSCCVICEHAESSIFCKLNPGVDMSQRGYGKHCKLFKKGAYYV